MLDRRKDAHHRTEAYINQQNNKFQARSFRLILIILSDYVSLRWKTIMVHVPAASRRLCITSRVSRCYSNLVFFCLRFRLLFRRNSVYPECPSRVRLSHIVHTAAINFQCLYYLNLCPFPYRSGMPRRVEEHTGDSNYLLDVYGRFDLQLVRIFTYNMSTLKHTGKNLLLWLSKFDTLSKLWCNNCFNINRNKIAYFTLSTFIC